MALVFHNTLSNRLDVFRPADPARVTVYVCGPTVYDRIHIGNARALVVFDLLVRLLRRRFGQDAVAYARNITDIDDKIIAAAAKRGVAPAQIAAEFADIFESEAAALGCLAPDFSPRATESLPDIVAMIERLLAGGFAYLAEGHVLFHAASFAAYGALSNRSRDEMIAGARVEVAPFKRDPADFVLWKPALESAPGWPSPWGRGRPGWHIECSAMAARCLGETIDIHGGGQDLIFPHHENEIAQSCCAFGHARFAAFWLHNGHVTARGEKMAKSRGNTDRLGDLLARHAGETLRYALLGAHYRKPLDWTPGLPDAAHAALTRLYAALEETATNDDEKNEAAPPPDFVAALENDMNTPAAFAVMHGLARAVRKAGDEAEKSKLRRQLRAAGAMLGLLQEPPREWLRGASRGAEAAATATIAESDIAAQIEKRETARRARDYAAADQIRAELKSAGIELLDSPTGVKWRRVS